MENTALFGILKWLFPALIGSLLAVYNKGKEFGFSTVSTKEKIYLIILALLCVCLSVAISYFVGGAAIEYLGFVDTSYAYKCVYFIMGMSGLKLVDVFMKNIDNWLDKLSKIVTKLIDKLSNKVE